jgi:hypothetical protein
MLAMLSDNLTVHLRSEIIYIQLFFVGVKLGPWLSGRNTELGVLEDRVLGRILLPKGD